MIQDDIFATLASLVSNRVYPMVAPDNVVKPYLVYQRVASVPENTLSSGIAINQTRIQIDMYTSNYKSGQLLAASVQSTISSTFVSSTLQLEQDFYEAETKLFRVMHDYSIWH